jgi:uncharacterized protein (DUF488 family)
MSTDLSLTIWTIGHSNRPIGQFIDLLKANRIEVVVDIRTLPGSKRCPQFNQETLRASLLEQAMEYTWRKELGGLRKLTRPGRNTAWKNKSFQAYAEHMETDVFKTGMAQVAADARRKRIALMCAEAVWWKCHRSLVADYLKWQGHTVMHIMSHEDIQEHPYTGAAQIRDGVLSYEA